MRKKGRDNVVVEIKKPQNLGGLTGFICTEERGKKTQRGVFARS
jgi:hypothetical protein